MSDSEDPYDEIHRADWRYALGALRERERMIALLEAERWELPDGTPAGGEIYLPIEQAIKLIKGENE